MAGQRVIVSVLADTKAFKREMNKLGDVTGFSKLRAGVGKVVTSIVRLTAAAGAAAVALGTVAVKAAADLEQSIGGVDAVFKDGADEMHKYATAAAETLGLSRNEYNELATVLGALMKNGGTSLDELGSKTNDLMVLGADMAATFGTSTTEAVNALSSALKGERDPIERYGVSLRQAAIDARAAEMGFEKVGGSLSAEATQAATLSLIMEQTADAHGQFGRESGTLSNKIQRTKAKLENMAATLGTYLLPVIGNVVDWLADKLEPALDGLKRWIENTGIPAFNRLKDALNNNVLPALKDLYKWIKDNVLPVIKDLGNWITDTLVPALMDAARWIKDNANWLIPLATALGTAVLAWQAYNRIMLIATTTKTALKAAQVALNAVMKANPIGIIITLIASLVAGLVTLYHTNEDFRRIVDTAWTAVKSAVEAVVTWFTDTALPWIQNFITGISDAWNNVKEWTTTAWNAVKTTISDAWNAVKSTVTGAIDSVKSSISGAWETVKSNTSTSWTNVKNSISTAWTNIKTAISDGIANIRTTISNLPSNILTWLGNLGRTLYGKGRDLIQGMQGGISDKVRTLTGIITYLPTRIVNWIGNLGRTLWNAGKQLIQGFIDGISGMFSAVRSKLGELTSALTSWKGPPRRDAKLLTNNGRLVIQSFLDGLESQYSTVRRSLTGFTDSLSGNVGTRLTAGAASTLNPSSLATSRQAAAAAAAAPVFNIELHTLEPSAETARTVAQALSDYRRLTGRTV